MAQPVWVTPAGSLGTIPEDVFYQVPLLAYEPDPGVPLYFRVIAGNLPAGMQCTDNGLIAGVPQSIASVQGVPEQVSVNVTSKFTVRVYTTVAGGPSGPVDRLADRTFEITVSGPSVPQFITPAGLLGTFYDGGPIDPIQIQYVNLDPGTAAVVRVASGQLPPGLTLSPTGLISGYTIPVLAPGGNPNYDIQPFDVVPFSSSGTSLSLTYDFVLEISNGISNNLRTFSIQVLASSDLNASTSLITADSSFVTADAGPTLLPFIITPQGSIGTVRNDNFYAFQFQGLDLAGDQFVFEAMTALPPGLRLDPVTGWLYGYIPDQGQVETTYEFELRVVLAEDPGVYSVNYTFSLNIIGNANATVTWLTPSNLGTIDNGATSTFYVAAETTGGINLSYRLLSGSYSLLPQGLELLPNGIIAGRVSFDTFAVDGGATTFDVGSKVGETTFDLVFRFNVNTYAVDPASVQTFTGDGYTSDFTLAGEYFTINVIVTINGVALTPFTDYYTSGTTLYLIQNGVPSIPEPPVAGTDIIVSVYIVNTSKEFSITVNRAYNEPYENLYIQAMPPFDSRDVINSLLDDTNIFPTDLLYRPEDPNFGLATSVRYWHAYGLTAATMADYVSALDLNHYWKNLVLNGIETAQALDANGNVLYEVVYSQISDNLVNNDGVSVGKEVALAYPVETDTTVVYPNSLVDMRDQVIDTVGQISNALPLWMLSKQANGQVLGFVPAWVICYVKPGKSGQIKYNIEQQFTNQLNYIDFEVDRYEVDRLLTKNWNPASQEWIPTPPTLTTFDVSVTTVGWQNNVGATVNWQNNVGDILSWINGVGTLPGTIFDGGSLQFIDPVDMYSNTQSYDKYLVFPKRTILG